MKAGATPMTLWLASLAGPPPLLRTGSPACRSWVVGLFEASRPPEPLAPLAPRRPGGRMSPRRLRSVKGARFARIPTGPAAPALDPPGRLPGEPEPAPDTADSRRRSPPRGDSWHTVRDLASSSPWSSSSPATSSTPDAPAPPCILIGARDCCMSWWVAPPLDRLVGTVVVRSVLPATPHRGEGAGGRLA
jgi:hypothetical protein